MILVIGAAAQGKREFAQNNFIYVREAWIEANTETDIWTDGGTASWNEFTENPFCFRLHLFVRRLLQRDSSLGAGALEWAGGWDCQETAQLSAQMARSGPERLAEYLMAIQPDRILVTNEIGCGIVPLDPFERAYREQTGRICCELAKRSEQVWRVSCGLGQRIK